jgi:hypothetical protein
MNIRRSAGYVSLICMPAHLHMIMHMPKSGFELSDFFSPLVLFSIAPLACVGWAVRYVMDPP